MTTHLTMVAPPDSPDSFVVVLTRMRGDAVVQRSVVSQEFISRNEALDEFQRLATRVFYFDEGEMLARAAS